MGKKKDCFGLEDYVCMTPGCPYAKDCIKAVWEKRMDRILARSRPAPSQRRRGRISAKG